jgi:LPXTG-site transpeptidase (sortase) family protein
MIRRTIRGIGELLITTGLVILLFATYEVYGKAFEVNEAQGQLDSALDQDWAKLPPVPATKPGAVPVVDKPIPGSGLARLYIPRLGKSWVVVEGVTKKDIKHAPGHYPDSQLPGQVGNFAMAGHRMPSVFWDLDKLDNGDPIVVETRTSWHVYRVIKKHVIRPTQVEVVSSNPENPKATATRKLITLTTCNPKWDNYQRLVILGELQREQPHTPGQRPAELGGL